MHRLRQARPFLGFAQRCRGRPCIGGLDHPPGKAICPRAAAGGRRGLSAAPQPRGRIDKTMSTAAWRRSGGINCSSRGAVLSASPHDAHRLHVWAGRVLRGDPAAGSRLHPVGRLGAEVLASTAAAGPTLDTTLREVGRIQQRLNRESGRSVFFAATSRRAALGGCLLGDAAPFS